MKEVTKIPFKTQAEWLELRKKGLGGSDAYQIILNKFGSAFAVWLSKTGRALAENEESVPMKHGTMLEPVIRDWFVKETGFQVTKPEYLVVSNQYPFMLASLDGIGVDNEGREFLLECKDTWNFENEKVLAAGDLPEYWIIQLHHYFLVTGLKYAYIAYWFGNRMMEYKLIKRDDELCQILLSREQEFWKLVEQDVEPAIDYADDKTEAYIRSKFNDLIDEQIDRPDLIDLVEQQYNLGQTISRLEKERKAITLQLQNEQGKFRKLLAGNFIASNSRREIEDVKFNEKQFSDENLELYQKYCEKIKKYTGNYTIRPVKGA